MPKIIFVQADKSETHVDAASGISLKDAAVDNSIDGVGADCGGSCACATCHVYIAPKWLDKIEKALDEELDTLDIADNVKDNSRLSCQVFVTDAMDGLKVHVLPQSA